MDPVKIEDSNYDFDEKGLIKTEITEDDHISTYDRASGDLLEDNPEYIENPVESDEFFVLNIKDELKMENWVSKEEIDVSDCGEMEWENHFSKPNEDWEENYNGNDMFDMKIEEPSLQEEYIKGYRIVDLQYVLNWSMHIQQKHSGQCPNGKMKILEEKQMGLISFITFRCDHCRLLETYCTEDPKLVTSDLNTGSVQAALSTKNTYTELKEFLTVLDIPCLSEKLFQRIEIEHNWWASMEKAGREEREWALQNGQVDEDGVPWIVVYLEGGWNHRSSGISGNVASGMGAIIGKHTQKLLFLGILNKYCTVCAHAASRYEEPSNHKCCKDWKEPLKAVEPEMIVEGFNHSQSMHGLKYTRFIADGDTNIFEKIKSGVAYGSSILKVNYFNSAAENLGKALADTAQKAKGAPRQLLSEEKITQMQNFLMKIIFLNANAGFDNLNSYFDNFVKHIYGDHTSCRLDYCHRVYGPRTRLTVQSLMKQVVLYGLDSLINDILIKLQKEGSQLIDQETKNRALLYASIIEFKTNEKLVPSEIDSLKKMITKRFSCTTESDDTKNKKKTISMPKKSTERIPKNFLTKSKSVTNKEVECTINTEKVSLSEQQVKVEKDELLDNPQDGTGRKTQAEWDSLIVASTSVDDLVQNRDFTPTVMSSPDSISPNKDLNIVSGATGMIIDVDVQNVDEQNTIISRRPKKKRHKFFCFFCEMNVNNFARHIIRNHASEPDVQQVLSKPENSKERKELLTNIRKKGNYLQNHQNSIRPMRQLSENSSFLPCIHCLGFYTSKYLWRHRKNCSKNPDKKGTKSQALGQNLLVEHLEIDSRLVKEVFSSMRPDHVSLVAKKDKLICAYAASYFEAHKGKHFINVTSQKMRKLARLVIELQKLKPEITDLLDALQPQYYNDIVYAANNCAIYALNMGTYLKQCCHIAIKKFPIQSDLHGRTKDVTKDLQNVRETIEARWRSDVAGNDPSVRNKVSLIPLAEDLKILTDFLKSESTKAADKFKDTKDTASYLYLLKMVYCQLSLLYRQRHTEFQKLPVDLYVKNDCKEDYDAFGDAISPTERILLKRFKGLILGKQRCTRIPVLFSTDVEEYISLLLLHRSQLVGDSNPFLFGKSGTDSIICGYKILRKYAIECGTKNPAVIFRSTIRKYVATITQLYNMNENDIEQLATFMGICEKNYSEIPGDAYQTARICKLLVLIEQGRGEEFKGKSLTEMEIDDIVDVAEDDEKTRTIMEETETTVEIHPVSDLPCSSKESTSENPGEVVREPAIMSQIRLPSSSKIFISKRRKKRELVPWTEHQKSLVKKFFSSHIVRKKPPKKYECDELITQYPDIFKNKSWLKIKVFVQNCYTKKYSL